MSSNLCEAAVSTPIQVLLGTTRASNIVTVSLPTNTCLSSSERTYISNHNAEFKKLGHLFIDQRFWSECETCEIEYKHYDTFIKDVLRNNGFYKNNYKETEQELDILLKNLNTFCFENSKDCKRKDQPLWSSERINSFIFELQKSFSENFNRNFYKTNNENSSIFLI
jgi:hypothetical protein